jgi:hypothetical protein
MRHTNVSTVGIDPTNIDHKNPIASGILNKATNG